MSRFMVNAMYGGIPDDVDPNDEMSLFNHLFGGSSYPGDNADMTAISGQEFARASIEGTFAEGEFSNLEVLQYIVSGLEPDLWCRWQRAEMTWEQASKEQELRDLSYIEMGAANSYSLPDYPQVV